MPTSSSVSGIFCRRSSRRHAVERAVEVHQRVAGVVVGELVVFGQVADAAGGRRPCRPAGRAASASPSVRRDDAEQDLDERGLAGAVLAEQAVDLALLDA